MHAETHVTVRVLRYCSAPAPAPATATARLLYVLYVYIAWRRRTLGPTSVLRPPCMHGEFNLPLASICSMGVLAGRLAVHHTSQRVPGCLSHIYRSIPLLGKIETMQQPYVWRRRPGKTVIRQQPWQQTLRVFIYMSTSKKSRVLSYTSPSRYQSQFLRFFMVFIKLNIHS